MENISTKVRPFQIDSTQLGLRLYMLVFVERPIKIEIITDEVPEAQATRRAPPTAPSLLSRLGGISTIEGPSRQHPGLNVPT